jgi:hypothetical protein
LRRSSGLNDRGLELDVFLVLAQFQAMYYESDRGVLREIRTF